MAQYALRVIRERTVQQPRSGAEAFIACVNRLLEEKTWSLEVMGTLEFFTAWAENAALVPVPHVRKSVARVIELSQRTTEPLHDRLQRIINPFLEELGRACVT